MIEKCKKTSRALLMLLLLLLSAGCAGAPHGRTSTTSPTGAGASLLGQVAALQHLPASTGALVVFARPDLVRGTDSAALLPTLATLASLLPGTSGHIPTMDTVGLQSLQAAVGPAVDDTGPVGAAVVDVRAQATIAFAQVADRSALSAALTRLARAAPNEWHMSEANGALIVSAANQGTGFVLRARWLYLVWCEVDSVRASAEIQLARRRRSDNAPAGVLAHPSFQRAAARLTRPGDAAAYVNAHALTEPMRLHIDALVAAADEAEAASRTRLRSASARKAATWERQQLETEVAQARRMRAQVHQQVQHERRLLDELLAGWGHAAASATLDGRAWQAQLAVLPVPGTMAARLLAPARSDADAARQPPSDMLPSSWRRAATRSPAALAARTEPAQLWSAVRLVGRALYGIDVEQLRSELTKDDKQRRDDRAPLGLSGEIAVAATDDRVTAAIGFRDSEAARSLFRQLAHRLGQPGAARSPDQRLAIDTPDRRVVLQLAAPYWSLTVAGRTGAGTARTADPAESAHAWSGLTDALADLAQGARTLAGTLQLTALAGPPTPAADATSQLLPPLPADENQDVPFSDEYRALQAEYRRLSEDRAQALDRRHRERTRAQRARLRAWGTLGLHLTRAASHVQGTVYMQPTGADMAALLAAHRRQRSQRPRDLDAHRRETDMVLQRARDLQRRLLQIRARDVQQWDLQQ